MPPQTPPPDDSREARQRQAAALAALVAARQAQEDRLLSAAVAAIVELVRRALVRWRGQRVVSEQLREPVVTQAVRITEQAVITQSRPSAAWSRQVLDLSQAPHARQGAGHTPRPVIDRDTAVREWDELVARLTGPDRPTVILDTLQPTPTHTRQTMRRLDALPVTDLPPPTHTVPRVPDFVPDKWVAEVRALMREELQLADRAATADVARQRADIVGYRRIIRPDLSEGGVCGLCLAASTQVYWRPDLKPLHDNCRCRTVPIVGRIGGPGDPGQWLNELDREALGVPQRKDGRRGLVEEAAYAASAGNGGTTDGYTMKQARFALDQDGRLAPVRTRAKEGRRVPREEKATASAHSD